MGGFANYLLNELIFRVVGLFFKTTGFLGALYLIVAVGLGLFVWSKVLDSLGDLGAALSCMVFVVLLLGLFAFLHARFFSQPPLGE
jgi:hypothetical protein